jgi:hypothetical protein
LSLERYFRDTVFGRRTRDHTSYDDAIAAVLTAAERFPYVVIQTRPRDAVRFERIMRTFRSQLETVSPSADETYIIGHK